MSNNNNSNALHGAQFSHESLGYSKQQPIFELPAQASHVPHSATADRLLRLLSSGPMCAAAIIAKELLDPPLSLRDRR
ncbi:MAG TPA: hypothetical protein VGZ00_03375 [Candidatus Baltobacteraceae bacterium]|jgi:hypothetical protein|nr:hypothetical protein [Candidatus Baltobacteraceae bacterium]